MWLQAEDLRLEKFLAGKPAPILSSGWISAEQRWRTQRGEYVLRMSELPLWAPQMCVCWFVDAFGRSETIAIDTRSEAERAALEHAARQPVYPALLGWPAGFELPAEVEA